MMISARWGTIALLALALGAGCGREADKQETAAGGAAAGGGVVAAVDDPEFVTRNNRGVGHMGRFEYGPAHEIFLALSHEHPGQLDVKVNLAIATFNRQQEGDEDEGIRLLEEVVAADPDHLTATFSLGLLRLRKGEIETAREHFRRVVEADPGDAYAVYALGQVLEQEDLEAALAWYLRAIELDPYLRSPYYRAFQLLQRAGRAEEAKRYLDDFVRLESNPRARLVEVKYTRMGPKAEAIAIDLEVAPEAAPSVGPVFLPGEAFIDLHQGEPWRINRRSRRPSVTVCDIDGDGRLDLFIAGADAESLEETNRVVLDRGADGFRTEHAHPLRSITSVNAALWGDFDNDGRTDGYFCRRGRNELWRHEADGVWRNVTMSTGTAGSGADTAGGAFFDADHDGDLDLFLVNRDGPNRLLNNNLDGSFTDIAAAQGIAGDGSGSIQVLPADLDGDRDLDLVVIDAEPPHAVYRNDRLWSYEAAEGFDALRTAEIAAVAAADRDADGQVELYAVAPDGALLSFAPESATGTWARRELIGGDDGSEGTPAPRQIAILDVDGDGTAEVIRSTAGGWVASGESRTGFVGAAGRGVGNWTPFMLDAAAGPSIVGLRPGAATQIWRPGPGRAGFAALAFSGRTNDGESMRSNASGIGTRAAIRVGSRWTIIDTLGDASGPGQSLQPRAVGLGGADRADFVAIDWSDGVFQSEIDVAAGGPHAIAETQRQLSSCPVLFAWNGAAFGFVSDVLGVGGMGYLLVPGEYASPRPWERFLLEPGALVPRAGRYALKLSEPMEEACYLDAVHLLAWDLPPGWTMTLDERMQVSDPAPTGGPRFYRVAIEPALAVNDRGEDVTALVGSADHRAPPVGALDERFIGRLERDHVLVLTWPGPIDARAGAPILLIDGWVEYPYSQTMFSAWQAKAKYRAPTIEARVPGGEWTTVLLEFGYPAGMPRQMSVPLEDLPAGASEVRISTNQEIFFDRIAIAFAEPCPDARRRRLEPAVARVAQSGFARRTTGPQRRPQYDYGDRVPFWDARHQRGYYTALGPMTDLVRDTDGALAIFGPGEEVHVEFEAPLEAVPMGWTRRLILEVDGWCKDMDLFTLDGETVGPLPPAGPDPARREALHERYNTRYRSGP